MEKLLQELNKFLGKASLATYAGASEALDPSKPDFVARFPGFKEYEYREGKFYYRDSYAGFFISAGQEAVLYNGQPVWSSQYGGGMEEKYQEDEKFAHDTFAFLKKALSAGEKQTSFQPRGPKKFIEGDWGYLCKWNGSITKFSGNEEIRYKDNLVFTHKFFCGLLKWK